MAKRKRQPAPPPPPIALKTDGPVPIPEAAVRLGMPTGRLRELVQAGLIPSVGRSGSERIWLESAAKDIENFNF